MPDETTETRIETILADKDPALRAVADRLRALVRELVPDVVETVNPWHMPTFESHGPMGYFQVGKRHVTFGLLRATSLPDPHGLLEGTGKDLRHVKLRRIEDLDRPALRELIVAAARLNREEPNEGMRRSAASRKRTPSAD
jgi:hypothetical protein